MNNLFEVFCRIKKEHPDHHTIIKLKDCSTIITILLGPNGTGKSMSLLSMTEECKKNKIKYVSYSNKHEDIVLKAGWDFDPYKLACAFHSEGERIHDSFDNWANSTLLKEILTNTDSFYVFIDELDSGLSIDRLKLIIHQWKNILVLEKDKHPNRDIKFIFTCNSFEMLEQFNNDNRVKRIWVPTKEYINPQNYEEFKERYIQYDKIINGGYYESYD